MWLGTFHSLSAKILRIYAKLVGLKSNFVILDVDDQLNLIKKICERENIDTKEKTPKYYLSIIDNYKNKSITSDSLLINNKTGDKNISIIYKNYQQELIRLNSVDFGDLILHCIKIFKVVFELYPKIFIFFYRIKFVRGLINLIFFNIEYYCFHREIKTKNMYC